MYWLGILYIVFVLLVWLFIYVATKDNDDDDVPPSGSSPITL